ncbi:hypothetical protein ACFL0C_02380, partial [Patescibacteria group bacterium]
GTNKKYVTYFFGLLIISIYSFFIVETNRAGIETSQFKSQLSIILLSVMISAIIESRNIYLKKKCVKYFKFAENNFLKQIRKHTWFYIVLASLLGLYLEMIMIRLHSSYFPVFSFFKNVSLLSCFLGLGIGFSISKKKPVLIPIIFPLFMLQIAFLDSLGSSTIATFIKNPINSQLTFGIGVTNNVVDTLLTVLIISIVYVFNALCFVPLGHLISKLMSKNDSLKSYSWNLIGSVIGVILLMVLAYFWLPPTYWLLIALLLFLPFVVTSAKNIYTTLILFCLIAILIALPIKTNSIKIFSPYQVLDLVFENNTLLRVDANQTYHQRIIDLSFNSNLDQKLITSYKNYYDLPYKIYENPNRVLIVGSGAGNDVAAALRNNSVNVTAVEIDPVILEIGKNYHPEKPYSDPRVTSIVQDARAHFKTSNQKYDMIVYGLLDSHTLLSNKSGVRLESYVYTVDAVKEAKDLLRENGIISLSFAGLNNKLGTKMYLMLKQAFNGKDPVVYYNGYDGSHTFISGENLNTNNLLNEYGQGEKLVVKYKDFNSNSSEIDLSTDDWPFFYIAKKSIQKNAVYLIGLLVIISAVMIHKYSGTAIKNVSPAAFFLGAGFMLIETKIITELALLYGSTWIVISITICSILVMAFFSNYILIKVKNININYVYLFILLSILFSLYFINSSFFDIPLSTLKIIVPIILTFPIFFSGLAFSYEIKKMNSIGTTLSSNLLGAMLGGFLEYTSLLFGFSFLYYLGILIYFFAYLFSVKRKK